MFAVLAIVVVLALIGAGALLLLQHGGGRSAGAKDREPSNAMPRQWEQTQPRAAVSGNSRTGLPGMWAVGQTLVLADAGGVRGYDQDTGAPKWTLKPPEHVGRPCAMSWHATANGLGAIAYDAGGGDCSVIAAVDINTGTVLWSKNLAGGIKDSAETWLTVNDRMISADLGTAGVARFDARAGTPVPLPKPAPSNVSCTYRYGLADHFGVMTSDCPGEGVTMISQLDTYAGKKYPADGRKVVAMLGEDPVTALFETDDERRWIQTFDHEGAGKPIELTGDLDKFHFDNRERLFLDKHVLIAEYEHVGGFGALDVTTGALLWHTPADSQYRLVGERDKKVLFVADGARDDRYARHQDLIAYDLTADQHTTVGALTRPNGLSPGVPSGCVFAFDGSRLHSACESSDQANTYVIDAYSVPLS
ncbi:outer membrane protein assembly factor BamB family protein [Kitasatospora sp. NPDC004531]